MSDPLLNFGRDLSSFSSFLAQNCPEAVPGHAAQSASGLLEMTRHGTTIVALVFDGGVLLAGDRRATMGNVIAMRDIDKVFITDEFSATGIAGTAGIAKEIVRLFTVELEHYEKIEGVPLSFDGKANRLAGMIRGNFSAAMQGLTVIPLFVGFDVDAADEAAAGRIISFDITGDRHLERVGYYSVGSGSVYAKSAIKKLYRPGISQDEAISIAIESLYDAADDDSATGGPDVVRQLFPTAVVVTAAGASTVADESIAAATQAVIDRRSGSTD